MTNSKTSFSKYGYYKTYTGPTVYSNNRNYETISTVCEQVGTHSLRSDALMKNGKTVSEAYKEKYGKDGMDSELYNYWTTDSEYSWADLVTEAKNIMGI